MFSVIFYRINFLDLLPNDVTKNINRKVQDLHKIGGKKNEKKIEKWIENKKKAHRKRHSYEKYVNLYKKISKKSKMGIFLWSCSNDEKRIQQRSFIFRDFCRKWWTI